MSFQHVVEPLGLVDHVQEIRVTGLAKTVEPGMSVIETVAFRGRPGGAGLSYLQDSEGGKVEVVRVVSVCRGNAMPDLGEEEPLEFLGSHYDYGFWRIGRKEA